MKNGRAFLAMILFTLGPAACGGSGGAFAQRFTAACTESSNLSEALCECMAERAEEELTEDARAFLLSSLEGDEGGIDEARAKLGVAEAMEAGLFMTEVGACAQSVEGAG